MLRIIAFHATTTKNWGINFGRHIPLKEWCLVCRFESEIKNTMIPTCAVGVVQIDSQLKEILGMLPFLSTAASVLVLADLAKLSLDGYPVNKDFIQFSMRSIEGVFITYQNPRRPCFVCKNHDASIYPTAIKTSKHWHLST